jgi:hypothetical protein
MDIESSGADRNKHQLLSIALLKPNGDHLYIEIKHPENTVTFCDEALQVNGFKPESVYSNEIQFKVTGAIKTTAAEAKDLISRFLRGNTQYIPVGYNVGTFDVEFLRNVFSNGYVHDTFSYRSVDLNSLIFTEAHANGKNFLSYKRTLGKQCERLINEDVKKFGKHCSFYDVWLAKHIFQHFCDKSSTPNENS